MGVMLKVNTYSAYYEKTDLATVTGELFTHSFGTLLGVTDEESELSYKLVGLDANGALCYVIPGVTRTVNYVGVYNPTGGNASFRLEVTVIHSIDQ